MRRDKPKPAFTLIELLVVIAVIALLLSIAVPAFVRVKERARRVICQSTVRSFHLAAVAYAAVNDGVLPAGGIGAPDCFFTITMLDTDDKLGGPFLCPNLFNPYKGSEANIFDGGAFQSHGQYDLLAYNYLGGFPNSPWPLTPPAQADWLSPQRTTDNPRLPLIAELNTWITLRRITFAPHGYWGPLHDERDSTNESSGGMTPKELGAVGGNLCTLDGAVNWKDIADMQIHRASAYSLEKLMAYW